MQNILKSSLASLISIHILFFAFNWNIYSKYISVIVQMTVLDTVIGTLTVHYWFTEDVHTYKHTRISSCNIRTYRHTHHAHMHAHTHINTHTHTHNMHAHVHACIHTHTLIHAHTHMHNMHAHAHAHTQTHTHMHSMNIILGNVLPIIPVQRKRQTYTAHIHN